MILHRILPFSILEDIDAAIARDPAARNRLEVGLLYPGIQAVLLYRVSHYLWIRGHKFLARSLSQVARWATGIEIHPGATIGRRFFVDHGMGVVVGETSTVGDDVTLYHGVTLGGVSPSVGSDSQRDRKRHPTLGDGVIVGSGAQVLGPVTVGRAARVGANAVVTKDVPAERTVIGVPAKTLEQRRSERDLLRAAGEAVQRRSGEADVAAEKGAEAENWRRSDKAIRFVPYGTPCGDIPDPAAKEMALIREEIFRLRQRLIAMEERLHEHAGPEKGQETKTLPMENGTKD